MNIKHIHPLRLGKFAAALTAALLFATPGSAQTATYGAVRALLGVHPATDCTLRRAASIDMERTSDGMILLPVSVEGHPLKFVLDLNNFRSSIFPAGAAAIKLDLRAGDELVGQEEIEGKHVVDFNLQLYGMSAPMATAEFISIGGSPQALFNLRILPANPFGNDAIAGVIGSDIGAYFDVDLDFNNKKLNLYLSDHCPGKVVYWAPEYASVPINADPTGHPTVEMKLDGKPLRTGFSTIQQHGFMSMTVSNSLLGINGSAPQLKPVVPQPSSRPPLYTYPFKTLTVEGITISDPQIDLAYDNAPECTGKPERARMNVLTTCYGGSDMLLGLSEMEKLHLYFSFAEQTLYFTAADAHR